MSPPARTRAALALARYGGHRHGAELRALGSGLDHDAFVVDDLVVRVAAPAAAPAVTREADLLGLLAGRLPLPVPAPRFADAEHGVLAYPALPGRPLLGRRPPHDAAAVLGGFLRELHRIDPGEVGHAAPVDPADPAGWSDDLDGPERLLRRTRDEMPVAARRLVLAHADLGAEHLLTHAGRISGVIDWADAAVTDPALDFARLLRDFGPGFLRDALDAYGGDTADVRDRVWFFARCAALEDLAHGRATGRHEYSRAAARSLRWLFPA